METPLSTRRITRSQALAMAAENSNGNNNSPPMSSGGENEESKRGVFKSRQRTNGGKHQEREKSALIDITNGSPIVGLAMGSLKTPSSTCSKKRMIIQKTQSKQATTPGSGESLLRGQVKTLLQKVEEEAVISKFSFEHNPTIRRQGGFVNSPMAVLAPTPTNTPQVYDFSATNNNSLKPFTISPVAENFNFSQMLNEIIAASNQQEHKGETDEKNVITRSLFVEFSDKFEGSDSSDSHQGCENDSSSIDSNASVCSILANASTGDDKGNYEEDEDYEYDDEEGLNELCEGMSKISVNNAAKFTGKHIRFVYNSDGELEGEEFEPSEILHLKGLPKPEGKHLRFPEEDGEEERGL